MRTLLIALAFPSLLLAAGCAASTDEPESTEPVESAETAGGTGETAQGEGAGGEGGTGETEEEQERTYAVGEQITVELTMYSAEDGGRQTAFFSGYRPTIEFDHLDLSVTCAVQLPTDLERFEPGQTHLVGLECVDEVVAHPDEAGFVLLEGGKENGAGAVVFTQA